ncbi:espin-like [Sycon ciliatum]|uniref:espin-like n=1 Tax=Sycon ciliatum TaxID=27933 RepID=UPI0031F6DBD0
MFDRAPPAISSPEGQDSMLGAARPALALYTSHTAINTLNELDDFLNVEDSSNNTSQCNSGTTSRGECSPRKASFSNSRSSSSTLVPAGEAEPCDKCVSSPNSLIGAVNNRHAECLKRLLNSRGADPQQDTTPSGVTCAHIAAKIGNLEALHILLGHDPKAVLYRDGRGATVAHVAAHNGHVDCLRELVTACDELGDLRNNDGATPAHFAASGGFLDALKTVVQASKTPNSRTTGGATPTYFAAQEGHTDCVQWLVEGARADPNLASNDGMTPLHAAAQTGRINTMTWLVRKAGCQVTCRTTDGATPVHFAAAKGHVNILQWMLNHHLCDGSETDDYGDTPVHDAAEQGQLESLRVFAMHRCNMFPTDKDSNTPLDFAIENKHRACAEFLRTGTAGSADTLNSISSALSNLSTDTTGSSSNDSQSMDFDYSRPGAPDGASGYTLPAVSKVTPPKKKNKGWMSGIKRRLSRDHV